MYIYIYVQIVSHQQHTNRSFQKLHQAICDGLSQF